MESTEKPATASSGSAPGISLPLVSLRVGVPQALGHPEATETLNRPWTSAIFKQVVTTPIWLDTLNLAGDEQADLRNHGGPDQALCAYPAAHYAYWVERLGLPLTAGSFGENLTIGGGFTEEDLCIGDVFAFGEAVVQISQPRSPCWKIARRWQLPLFSQWLQETGFTGWYLRVVQPGLVDSTNPLQLVERPHPEWTIARANSAKYDQRHDRELVAQLAACPALGEHWRSKMQGRANGSLPLNDDANRLVGPNAE
ncbi:MOSC domain-containing protein [Hymenobacter tibetensis]|uniref:MOSC domain-containing protein n=1 Tax=Hymenobacter tibetensis TaxID=497967 RepID=A0ABY4D190_9BACT|nr:MOSC domain-containing protein [Hymenobacter tibetensis]UOG76278.1 MOSC domain-containing protein [Hymenobacter tibetensis]